MSRAEAIGVDLGGTKMLVGVVTAAGEVVHRRVIGSRGLGSDELIEALRLQLEEAIEARPRVAAIGLGVPCTIDRERGLCVSAVNLPMRDVPLREIVASRFGLPVSIDNDGNAAAIAEHRWGAAVGARNVVLLTIGTGIGGGLIIEGEPYRGTTGAGAEMGHVVIDINGPPCQGNCPNHGCIESIASGTALAREASEAAVRHPDSALGQALERGMTIDGRLTTELAHAGDAVATEVLATIGRRLGAALSGQANIFDPDVMLLGGGVMAAGDLILGPAREEFATRALPPQDRIPIRAAALGADAGMVGAAVLALEEIGESIAFGAVR